MAGSMDVSACVDNAAMGSFLALFPTVYSGPEWHFRDQSLTIFATVVLSAINLLRARSQELDELLPGSILDGVLPLLMHWLLHRVCLVGISPPGGSP
ncbi:hypothetical protein EAD98_17840 [Micromonospora sp. CV4]|nr:hypothetical protein EAD98_17840 [Micromonospora sp. CV4]